jgi:hypothetical protein
MKTDAGGGAEMPETFLLRYLVDRQTTRKEQWYTASAVKSEGSDSE